MKTTIIILLSAIFLFSWAGRFSPKPTPSSLPFRSDVQKALRDMGYDIGDCGADGNIGKATNRAWEKYENDVLDGKIKAYEKGYYD